MSENNQEIDRNALFVQALQERMAEMVVEYETKVAQLRVELTVATQGNDVLSRRVEELEGASAIQKSAPD